MGSDPESFFRPPSLTAVISHYILPYMLAAKTTLYIPDELFHSAQMYTGIREKTRLVQEGLKALIREKSAERLALLGGTDPKAEGPIRKKTGK